MQRNPANIERHRRKNERVVVQSLAKIAAFLNITKQGELHMPFVNALLTTQVQ